MFEVGFRKAKSREKIKLSGSQEFILSFLVVDVESISASEQPIYRDISVAYSLNQGDIVRAISSPCGLTFKSNVRPVILARFFRMKVDGKGRISYMAGC